MSVFVDIRLATDRVNTTFISNEGEIPPLCTPGEIVSAKEGFMNGHGTYIEDDNIKASVAGVIERVNKLKSVKPLKNRYVGEIGDVVVGRVTEVQQKRWKVDTNSRLDSILLLSSVNLPGGELRRRSVEDEQMMRKYLQEGDLVSAEVQNIFEDGSLSLSMRSLKYGKLSQGVLIKVFPSLIKRRKTHFHNLSCGASLILGNNGFIWICPPINSEESAGGFVQNLNEMVPKADREVIVRLRNCVLALAQCNMMLYDTSILYAFEESMKYHVSELLQQEPILDVAVLTQHRLKIQEI
ncbi:exosome complex component RRP4 [Condylostylus longicornis]|uniref:exosome complex component RRP4 n=1 Tax=Condylostylus longicornis TaxID=2530218 RepID=UPI00244DAB0F|nr:exosome complex component RRP4 [Condylostylus longicornis]